MSTHTGSCHCGAVTYEVSGEFTEAIKCNCSHCSRKGFLLAFVPEDQFKLTAGEDHLTTYHFNKHAIDHQFCKTCGVESFAHGQDSQGNKMVAINLNCLENFDVAGVQVTEYDGKSA